MLRSKKRFRTREELEEEYRRDGTPELALRVSTLLDWASSTGRLLLAPTITPAFGIAGDNGGRILSIREISGTPLRGRISLFVVPENHSSPAAYREFRDRLLEFAVPAANTRNKGSFDVAPLVLLEDDEFQKLMDALNQLGPAPAVPAV